MGRFALLFLIVAVVPARVDGSERGVDTALEGTRVVIHRALPAHRVGLEVDATSGEQLDEGQFRRTMKMWGPAYLAGDTTTITRVKIGKRQMELYLGRGGFGSYESIVAAREGVPAGYASDQRRRQIDEREEQLKYPLRPVSEESQKWIDLELDALARERARLSMEDQMEDQAKSASAFKRLAPRWGSRIHLRFRQRMPNTIMTPEGVLALLAGYLTAVEPSDSTTAGEADSIRVQEPTSP